MLNEVDNFLLWIVPWYEEDPFRRDSLARPPRHCVGRYRQIDPRHRLGVELLSVRVVLTCLWPKKTCLLLCDGGVEL